MIKNLEFILSLFFILAIAASSQSKKGRKVHLEDPLLRADYASETASGATNAVGALGNGELTVGISPWAEVVYFRYPHLSFYDHLRYFTYSKGFLSWVLPPTDMRYAEDAPNIDWEKYGRPYERYSGLGAKAGIYIKGKTLWMDDPVWESSRTYEPEWGPILITTLKNPEAEIKVKQWVLQSDNLLVQEFHISSDSVERFFYYGTFAPWKGFDKGYGETDSPSAGFASVFCKEEKLLIWFYPEVKDRTRIEKFASNDFSPGLLDELYPEGGIFIALGFDKEPDGFQVGADRAGRRVSRNAPLSAREDAEDGKLSGNKLFIGQASSGLSVKPGAQEFNVSVFISVAQSAKGAQDIIMNARLSGVKRLEEEAIRDSARIASRVYVPQSASSNERRVARRAILNLFIGRDKKTGAIVASPSRQPAYNFDWPRDGAFYDLALDLAGFPDVASEHLNFYKMTQRKEKFDASITWLVGFKSPFYSPRGHWYSNIRTDGAPGRLSIIPVEIDESALLVWDIWRHEFYVPEEQRRDYQENFRDTLELATDAILEYVDIKKGWTKKVMEDDNAFPGATLHGASSVLTALASAVDAGKRWGIGKEKLKVWENAERALREGMLKRINDPKVLEDAGWRGIQWALFPAPLFQSYSDPRAKKLIDILAKDVEEKAGKTKAGYAYLGEEVFILAIATADMPEYKELLRKALKVLTEEARVEGTDCYGEVVMWKKIRGEETIYGQNRTSIPHLWSGVTVYLSTFAIYEPEKFLKLRPPLPQE